MRCRPSTLPWLALAAGSLLACRAAGPPRLLLLLTVDTLRADHLGAYGSTRGLTPHLDALARESLVFGSAFAASSFTLPSMGALFTGREPASLGLWSNESRVPDSAPTLATELRARGWRTAAVVSNFVLRTSSGLARGFELFDDELPEWEDTRGLPERTAGATTDAALAILDLCLQGSPAGCFLWVHYQDPHGPYTPPGDVRGRYLAAERAAPGGTRLLSVRRDHMGMGGIPRYQFLEGAREVAFYRAGYAGEVAYVDREVGRLLDGLRGRGLWDASAIAFLADHGEALGESDYWFAHGELLLEPLVRVPLLLRGPGIRPGRRDEVVSQVDLFPTLLRLAGAGGDPAARRGRDLLAAGAEQRPSVPLLATQGGGTKRRYGIVEGDYKFVLSERDGVWDGQLTRLGDEEVDLSAAAPQVAAALRERLGTLIDEVDTGAVEVRQKLSPEDRERLQTLGYLE